MCTLLRVLRTRQFLRIHVRSRESVHPVLRDETTLMAITRTFENPYGFANPCRSGKWSSVQLSVGYWQMVWASWSVFGILKLALIRYLQAFVALRCVWSG